MQKRAKNEVLGHLSEFDLFGWSDIAYNDGRKYFSTFDHGYKSCLVN